MSGADRLAILIGSLLLAATAARTLMADQPTMAPVDPMPASAPVALAPVSVPAAPAVDHNVFAPMRPAGTPTTASAGFELIGVAISGSRKTALLRQPDGRVKELSLGQSWSGWTVVAIEPGQASLRRGEANATLRLVRSSRGPVFSPTLD